MISIDDWTKPHDADEFRRALGNFATGITIVTGVTTQGARFGLTASSFQPVSLSPPLVLYGVRKQAASCDLVKESGRFCVNVLGAAHADLAKRFAAPIADRFADRDWHMSEGGCPTLPDAIAVFDCQLWTTYDGGDHDIVIGKVEALRCPHEGKPLLRFRGEFHPIGLPDHLFCGKAIP
jgi:flavin reductase (DIM6/NTAB) family NADH-FMN oxidoreductase RutF